MDDSRSKEYAEALRSLRSRLDRDLVEQLDIGDFAGNLLQHLRGAVLRDLPARSHLRAAEHER